jgi:hypothetical protein
MTEVEWQAGTNLVELLRAARPRLTKRKKGLLLIGLSRRLGHLLKDPRSRSGLEVTERWLDGRATEKELKGARQGALAAAQEAAEANQSAFQTFLATVSAAGLDEHQATWIMNFMQSVTDPDILSARAALHAACAGEEATRVAAMATNPSRSPSGLAERVYYAIRSDLWASGNPADYMAVRSREEPNQCALLRDLLGSASCPKVDRSWLNRNVMAIGKAVDADQAFDQFPILADALEEAGCDNQPLLAHCRDSGSHVRGCWVVDLLLSKE